MNHRSGSHSRGAQELDDSSDVVARFEQAKSALHAGRSHEAARVMEELLARAPREPVFCAAYGKALAATGELEQAKEQYARAISFDPSNVVFHLSHGELCLKTGEHHEARRSFQRAVIMVPDLHRYATDDRVPADVRAGMRLAVSSVAKGQAEFARQTLVAIRREFPAADISRLEARLHNFGYAPPAFANPRRRPARFYLPGVAEVPWYEPDELPWAAEVQELYPAIKKELEGVLDGQVPFAPYIEATPGYSATGSDYLNLRGSMDWNALHLFDQGTPREEIHARCPVTASLAERVPYPRVHGSPEVFFSRLRPGAHIRPHFGQMNVRLTVHLGLVIPEDCGIRVLDEQRHWQPGQILAFDDSFEHEAWNWSKQDRIVLIFEAWHPDVTEVERFGIEKLFELRRGWFDQFVGDPLMAPAGSQPRIEWL